MCTLDMHHTIFSKVISIKIETFEIDILQLTPIALETDFLLGTNMEASDENGTTAVPCDKSLSQEAGPSLTTCTCTSLWFSTRRLLPTLPLAAMKDVVIKAQVLSGGRGRGHFDNGFHSGVHMCLK